MPSLPPQNPAPLRHLGTSSGPKPLRSPAVLGLLALLVLVALPVYLLRRPKPTKPAVTEPLPRAETSIVAIAPEAGPPPVAIETAASKRIVLADPKTARCTPKGGGRATAERCDRVAPFEDALARAIRDNVACAPPAAGPYTVSFVLSLDFDKKSLHLWAGRSGSMKKRSAGDLIRCVEHALVPPDWETVAHQFQKYDVNLMAAYPGSAPSLPTLGAPNTGQLGTPMMPAFGAAPISSLGNPSFMPAAPGFGATPIPPFATSVGPASR
ncbi:MAG TPA: hypothetical protein VK550_09640 [Polyangiaceae bacterium]|nr:hypothetical protein [Polyangiaceae bacterium]